MRERVFVTGASSQLGVFLLPRLSTAGFRVLAFSRKAPLAPVGVSECVQWNRPGREAGPASHLVSCGPIGLALQIIAGNTDLRRVVAFSTTSVLTKAESENRQEKALIADIRAAEQRLRTLCEQQGIALTLIRPTLIYGCGMDRTISLMAKFGRRFRFIPLASNADGLRQPVHADDLAALAVNCLLNETAVRLESAACGGSTLSYREMMEKTAAACGQGIRTLTLDGRVLAGVVRLAAWLPGLKGVNPEMVRRQGRDMVFDDSGLRTAPGYQPRPFDPLPEDFEIPEYARKLQLPG
jgi:nucleoside-diphosphate-sugar epimerase